MKKYINILAGVALAMGLASCNDFLDKEVLAYQTDQNSYDTYYKIQSTLNATYDILQTDVLNTSDMVFGQATSEDGETCDVSLASQMGQLVTFRYTTSNTYIRDRWAIYYKGIHRANQVIANIHRVRISNDQYATYRQVRYVLGQALFLRAYYYFNLVRTFGGVPIRPEIETVDNLVIPRSSLEECYAYIEHDLREAAVLLPKKFVNTEAGKAGAGAAVGLLMKVLMYQAKPGVESEKWEEMARLGEYFVEGKSMTYREMLKWDTMYEGQDWEAWRKSHWYKPQELNLNGDPYETLEDACEMLSNNYTLVYKDYYGNKISYIEQFYRDAEFSDNSVFEISFKESADGTTDDSNEGCSIFDTMIAGTTIYSTNAELGDVFDSDDGRGQNPITLGFQQYTSDGQSISIPTGRNVSAKWYTPLAERPLYSGDNGKNRRIMRYAEVVLMYAEALNETGHPDRALVQLNAVKMQANTINNINTTYKAGGYAMMRDNIWKERRAELYMEFDRFFDIVRQGRAAQLLHRYGQSRIDRRGAFFIQGVNEIFPIPQTEIDLSNGVLVQNPGY